jgi:channel protein (hemolysin III family)
VSTAAAIVVPIAGVSDPVSSCSHLLAAGAAIVAAPALLRLGRGRRVDVTALAVYATAVVVLFGISGVYHLLARDGAARAIMQRADHAAIWLLIAGTNTPVHVLMYRGLWRWGALAAIWCAAIAGIVLKTVFFDAVSETAGTILYLAFGWIGITSCIKIAREHRGFAAIRFLFWGGVAYSAGAVIVYCKPPMLVPGAVGPHDVFHLAVVAGAAFHWRFIASLPRLCDARDEGLARDVASTPRRRPATTGRLATAER